MIYAAILKNEATRRYHPILFRPAPRPSDEVGEGRVCRHRSLGHHADGFGTVEEAREMIRQSRDLVHVDLLLTWDGSDIPAMALDLPVLGEGRAVPSCP